jgi:hypothetical protein
MAKVLAQLQWVKATGTLELKVGLLASKGKSQVKFDPQKKFISTIWRLERLGCKAGPIKKLLHIATIPPEPLPYPSMRQIKLLADKMEKLAIEIKGMESTGFIWAADVERDPDRFPLLSSKEAIADIKQMLPYRLRRRSKEYRLWLKKNAPSRIDKFQRLPLLLIGLYTLWATYEARYSEAVQLLNCVSGINRKIDLNTYRRQIKEFVAECPRTYARLESIFDLLDPDKGLEEAKCAGKGSDEDEEGIVSPK